MIFSNGFIYRWGIRTKEFGERVAHKRVLGIPVLRWCCGPVIALGLAVKDLAMSRPVGEK
jgi:hypothetical protein